MNIDELTIKHLKEIKSLLNTGSLDVIPEQQPSLNEMINRKVIIRTYSAGCWFGTLYKKAGSEVIITNARRMWRWKAAKSISLSAVAEFGINAKHSSICTAVESVWLDAIEIIPCSAESIKSIEDAEDAKAL